MAFRSKVISKELLETWKELYKTKYNKKNIWKNSLIYMLVFDVLVIGLVVVVWGWRMDWKFDFKFWIIFLVAFFSNTVFWLWQLYNRLKIWSIVTNGGDDKKLVRAIFWASGRGGPESAVAELERYKQKQNQKVDK